MASLTIAERDRHLLCSKSYTPSNRARNVVPKPFRKEPGSNYFYLRGPCSLCHNYLTAKAAIGNTEENGHVPRKLHYRNKPQARSGSGLWFANSRSRVRFASAVSGFPQLAFPLLPIAELV